MRRQGSEDFAVFRVSEPQVSRIKGCRHSPVRDVKAWHRALKRYAPDLLRIPEKTPAPAHSVIRGACSDPRFSIQAPGSVAVDCWSGSRCRNSAKTSQSIRLTVSEKLIGQWGIGMCEVPNRCDNGKPTVFEGWVLDLDAVCYATHAIVSAAVWRPQSCWPCHQRCSVGGRIGLSSLLAKPGGRLWSRHVFRVELPADVPHPDLRTRRSLRTSLVSAPPRFEVFVCANEMSLQGTIDTQVLHTEAASPPQARPRPSQRSAC